MRNRSILFAGLGLAAALGWQWATVRANYGGNWTALFCTGAMRGVPPTLASEHIYLFPGSTGFDGQMYHYIAHDPLMRDRDLKRFVDDPRMRYRRILVPALAWVLALGRSGWIDGMYLAVSLMFVGLGVLWSAQLLRGLGWQPGWGLLFLLLPATVVSADRLVADGALGALTVAFVFYSKRPCWQLSLVLAAATLTRETGLLLLAGYCGYLLLDSGKRDCAPVCPNARSTPVWRRGLAAFALLLERRRAAAALFLLSAAPAVLWYRYVRLHSVPDHYLAYWLPLSATFGVMVHPVAYPAGVPLVALVHAADLLALAGTLLAFGLAVFAVARGCYRPECLTALLFALMGIFLQRPDVWQNVFSFGRLWTPLLILLAVLAVRTRSVTWLLPWALLLPRLGMQMAPQVLGVIQAVF